MPINTSISIIIPNYNGLSLLEANIPFLYDALITSGIDDYEIIVADDASTDLSLPFLKSKYPDVILVENAVNRGFSANTNSGIKIASKVLVLILNSDAKLSENYFSPLLPYFEQEETFGVMGKVLSTDGRRVLESVKRLNLFWASLGHFQNDINESRTGLHTAYLCGANALIDRKKLIELGGFSEIYDPYNFEDVDLGLKAWRKGYKLYYENASVCYHHGSATINKQDPRVVRRVFKRNKITLNYLNLSKFQWFVYVSSWLLKSTIYTLVFKPIYLQAYMAFRENLKNYKGIRKDYARFQDLSLLQIRDRIQNKNKGSELRVLMYHTISEENRNYCVVRKDDFERQIQHILSEGFTPVFVQDLLSNKELPKRSVVIMFDDAYQSNAELLFPLIEKYQIKVSIALVINQIGKTSEWDGEFAQALMSLETLQRAPKGLVEYLYHSYSHINYRDHDYETVAQDIDSCMLEAQKMDLPLTSALVYPYGCLMKDRVENQRLFSFMRNRGIECAFTINKQNAIDSTPIRGNYEIDRIHIDGRDSMIRFKMKLKYGGFER